MNQNKKRISLGFQTFYASKEETNCPLLVEMLKFYKKIEEIELSKIIVSLKYARRILINSNSNKTKDLERKDFIEVVDYDPVKNNLLIIGKTKPLLETPLHYMIHHARKEVTACVQIKNKKLAEHIKKNAYTVKTKSSFITLEYIKEVLRGLREKTVVVINDEDVLFTSESIEKIGEKIIKIYEELK